MSGYLGNEPEIVPPAEPDEKFKAGLAHYQEEVAKVKQEIDVYRKTHDDLSVIIDVLTQKKNSLEAEIAKAQDSILFAGQEAQSIINEATRVSAEKVKATDDECSRRRQELDSAINAHAAEARAFDIQKDDFNAHVKRLNEQEKNLSDLKTTLEEIKGLLEEKQSALDQERLKFTEQVADFVLREKALTTREVALKELSDALDTRLEVFEADRAALVVREEAHKLNVAALQNLDEERKKFEQEKLDFGTVRDALLAREQVLDEYENQLKRRAKDLDAREKIFNDKVIKGE